jgi:hypothetical protein
MAASNEEGIMAKADLESDLVTDGMIKLTGSVIEKAMLDAHPSNPETSSRKAKAVVRQVVNFWNRGKRSQAVERMRDALLLAEERGQARAFLLFMYGEKSIARRFEAVWALPYGIARKDSGETIREGTESREDSDGD